MSWGWAFVIGVFVGAIIGIFVMALACIAKQSDDESDEQVEDGTDGWQFDKRI